MKKLLLFLTMCLTTLSLSAQSYNSCNEALGSSTASAGTYSVATINGAVPSGFCFGDGANVTAAEWIKYVPTDDFSVTVSSDLAVNGDKDTRLHIFKGQCGSLICVAGDDDSGVLTGTNSSSYLSIATFDAELGETYYIVWDNKWTNSSNFDFTISEKDMNLLHGLARNYRAVPCALGTNHQIDLPSRHGVNGLELI